MPQKKKAKKPSRVERPEDARQRAEIKALKRSMRATREIRVLSRRLLGAMQAGEDALLSLGIRIVDRSQLYHVAAGPADLPTDADIAAERGELERRRAPDPAAVAR